MSAPRVLHVSAVEYSARTLLFPQLRHLQAHGYQVRLACAPDGAVFRQETLEFSPVRVRLPRTPNPARLALGLADLRVAVRRIRPDLLHLHSPAAALAARLVPWPRSMRLVYTVHGFAHQWDRLDRRYDRAVEGLERALSRHTDALLFQSREDFEQCRRRGYRSRLVHLGNGVEDAWWDLPVATRGPGPLRLLFVGRLVAEKGVLDLLDAVSQVDGVELTVVGGQIASERDGVEARVRAWPGIRVTGHLDKPELMKEMSEHDCLVLPSYREGVPRSVIEAMAAGRPVVATAIRGCRELVTPDRTGLLVPPGDVPALAAALRRMRDLPDFDAWAAASREVAGPYRESAVFERLVRVYEDLL